MRAETGFHGNTARCWLCPLQQTHKNKVQEVGGVGLTFLILPDPTDPASSRCAPQRRT